MGLLHGSPARLRFLCSVIIGYAFILPSVALSTAFDAGALCRYDFSTFLAFAATDRSEISY
jgi:hypothetical protein